MVKTTRRFNWRPSSVSLLVIGVDSPIPIELKRAALMPFLIKYFFTEAALPSDNKRL